MPALAGFAVLDEVVAGFLLLLFLDLTYPIWSRAVVALFNQLPYVGGWLAAHIDQLLASLYAGMRAWVDSGTGAVANLLESVSTAAYWVFEAPRVAVYWQSSALWHLRYALLPAAVNALEVEFHGIADAIISALYTVRDQLEVEFHGVADAIVSALYAVQAGLRVEFHAVADAIVSALYAVQAGLRSEFHAVADGIVAALYAVRAEALAEIAATRDFLLGQLGRVQNGLEAELGQVAHGLEGAITDAEGRADAHADAGIAAAAGAAALGISAVGARVSQLENSSCQQQCLPLGRLGGNLMAADAMLLVILGAALVADPRATTRAVESTLGPLVSDAQQLYRSLFGVR